MLHQKLSMSLACSLDISLGQQCELIHLMLAASSVVQ